MRPEIQPQRTKTLDGLCGFQLNTSLTEYSRDKRASGFLLASFTERADMAQLYEENGSIKPGDFILVEQRPSWHSDGMVIKYWFEKRSDA